MLFADASVIQGKKKIPSSDTVPGEVCLFALGEKAPATMQLTSPTNLVTKKIDLRRESMPIEHTDFTHEEGKMYAKKVPLGDKKSMAYGGEYFPPFGDTGEQSCSWPFQTTDFNTLKIDFNGL